MSKTPSDVFAFKNALGDLKRVIAEPVPDSEVVEEERQRRALEAFIHLERQKKSVAGAVGAGKKKKSKGIGIYYEEKKKKEEDATPSLSEQREISRRAAEKQEEERKEKRKIRRQNEEWSQLLGRLNQEIKQDRGDRKTIEKVLVLTWIVQGTRHGFIEAIKENPAKYRSKAFRRAELEDGIKRVIDAVNENGVSDWVKEKVREDKWLNSFLFYSADRAVSWTPPFTHEMEFQARTIRHFRFLRGIKYLNWNAMVPPWLDEAIKGLHNGVNTLEFPGGKHVRGNMF